MESAGVPRRPDSPPTRRSAMPPSRLLPLPLALLVLGCATTRPFDRSTEPGGRPLTTTTAGAVILTGESLAADVTLSVLDAIRRVLPQLRVSNGAAPSLCPVVELRGKDSVT